MERPLEKPEIVKITKSVDEAEGIKTIFLKSDIKAKPGQFVMVWIPRLDEKPFAISYSNGGEIGTTVAAIGPFSNKLCSMKPGEKVALIIGATSSATEEKPASKSLWQRIKDWF